MGNTFLILLPLWKGQMLIQQDVYNPNTVQLVVLFYYSCCTYSRHDDHSKEEVLQVSKQVAVKDEGGYHTNWTDCYITANLFTQVTLANLVT